MVVSDLRMSPMDGLQLLGEIRAKKPGLPVLLMTAFGDVDKAVAAMRGGACDFMLKPFEPRALLDQIERYANPPLAAGVVAADARTREVLLLPHAWQKPMPRCCSPASRELARRSSRAISTTSRIMEKDLSSRSTVRRFRTACLRPPCWLSKGRLHRRTERAGRQVRAGPWWKLAA